MEVWGLNVMQNPQARIVTPSQVGSAPWWLEEANTNPLESSVLTLICQTTKKQKTKPALKAMSHHELESAETSHRFQPGFLSLSAIDI